MGNQITDIHAHVLPGLDDGPANIEESNELLAKFYETKTDRVLCTSHFLSPHFDVSLESVNRAYRSLTKTQRSVVLGRGAEVRLTSSLVEIIQVGQVPTLGDTQYVLVEFRSDIISQSALELVHELIVRDYHPIMAHPERNVSIQKDPSLLEELIEAGLLFQLTALCFDKPSRQMHVADKLAWKILEDEMATVIASDAHNTATRPPGLITAYDNIAARLGQSVSDRLIENANAIWENEPSNPVAVEKERKSLLRTIFRG